MKCIQTGPRKTAGAAFHFLYGQDAGFRDLYVGPSFGSHQQGLLLIPQKHTAKAHLSWAKGQLHDHYLPDPRLKCVLHVNPPEVLFASEQAAWVTASPRDTVKSYSRYQVVTAFVLVKCVQARISIFIGTSGVSDKAREPLQGTRTFAALRGVGVGVGPVGGPK